MAIPPRYNIFFRFILLFIFIAIFSTHSLFRLQISFLVRTSWRWFSIAKINFNRKRHNKDIFPWPYNTFYTDRCSTDCPSLTRMLVVNNWYVIVCVFFLISSGYDNGFLIILAVDYFIRQTNKSLNLIEMLHLSNPQP